MLDKITQKLSKIIDQTLDSPKSSSRPTQPELPPVPQTQQDFIRLLRRTPKTVLSDRDRAKIAAAMTFDSKIVKNLMTPRENLIFVHENDFLGPLTLDKLYKSGSTYFPVVDSKNHVQGIVHTESLNALEIKTLDRAKKYLDQNVFYLHELDPLSFAIEEFSRTGSPFFLVLDQTDALAGSLSVSAILQFLTGI